MADIQFNTTPLSHDFEARDDKEAVDKGIQEINRYTQMGRDTYSNIRVYQLGARVYEDHSVKAYL